MTDVSSERRAGEEDIAAFGFDVLERSELVPASLIVHGTEAKGRNFDIGHVLVDGGTFVVLLGIFVAEHLAIDVLVDVVQARGIGANGVRQLFEVFLAHKRFELG